MRLEQQDSYQQIFTSTVLERDGEWLRLAESLFYPTSGGQPCDTGTLDDVPVTEVVKRGDTVWHRVPDATFEEGQTLTGNLDWPKRYRHMQRHTTQHLLSQAFLRLNDAFETHSVSLNGHVCTVDFSGDPQEDDLSRAETLVNEVSYANLPVTSFEVEENDVDNYSLRRPPKVSGTVRLVRIGDFELSACGGTHLKTSAEALPIKLLGANRIRRGLTRVSFCCGWEALEDYRLKHDITSGLAVSLSSAVETLPERFAALQNELKHLSDNMSEAHAQLATTLAERVLMTADGYPLGRLVCYCLEEEKSALLEPLAKALGNETNVVALLGVDGAERARLLFVRGENVDLDLREVLRDLGARGGGSADRVQGVIAASQQLETVLQAAKALVLSRAA